MNGINSWPHIIVVCAGLALATIVTRCSFFVLPASFRSPPTVERACDIALTDAGFEVEQKQEIQEGKAEGIVLRQDPDAGQKIDKGGKVTIVVSDKSSIHNFHLVGPGVNVKTSVSATGTKTFKLTLKKGTYTFYSDPHKSIMHGSFTVK